ncbi:MAG: hypothetical protein ACLPVO_00435 [Desulfomonilaceae bacterium]
MISEFENNQLKYELKFFLNKTLSLLEDLAYRPVDSRGRPFFLEDVVQQVRPAWEEFNENFNVKDAENLIDKVDDTRLKSFGLYGKQLTLKLAVIDAWEKKYRSAPRKFLLKYLDAIDTLLGSLLAMAGIDEALKEIKDIFRNSIDEEE